MTDIIEFEYKMYKFKKAVKSLGDVYLKVINSFIDYVKIIFSTIPPSTTEIIDVLGLTEADISSVNYNSSKKCWVVKTYNWQTYYMTLENGFWIKLN